MLLAGVERPGYRLRGGSGATSLHGRIGTELPHYLQEGRAPFEDWHNGAYVLESFPCALWCFLASALDFEQTFFAVVYGAGSPPALCWAVRRHRHARTGRVMAADPNDKRGMPWPDSARDFPTSSSPG